MPTNATCVLLPKFVTIKGTLGEPKSDLNELASAACCSSPAWASPRNSASRWTQIGQSASRKRQPVDRSKVGDHQPALHERRAQVEPAGFVQEEAGGQTQTSMRELERLVEALQRHWLVRK
jgi:hypothetical protein